MSLTTVVFYVAFLGGAFLALTRHPIFGLLTYVSVFFLSPSDRWWATGLTAELRWSLLSAAIALMSMLIHRDKLTRVVFWRRGPVAGLLLFTLWLAIQLAWVPDADQQLTLLTMYAKFLVVLYMVVRCVGSARHLRWFVWAHVFGCFYFGWIVVTKYHGGRFEGFGGPGLDDANAGALALATGVLAAAGLFLAGKLRDKVATVLTVPIVLNGLVATVSRSGFLATAVGGLVFNAIAPRRFRKRILGLSVLGLALVFLVTNPTYWARMASLKYAGEEVANVDTGEDRVEILRAQWRMFLSHPLGCGHRCTASLSASYLDDKYLTGRGGERSRSSHNTFMSLMVEQGVVGGLFYVAMILWLVRSFAHLRRRYLESQAEEAALLPSIAAVLAGIAVADMFVDFLMFEIRIWYMGLAIVLLALSESANQPADHGGLVSLTSEFAADGRRPSSRQSNRRRGNGQVTRAGKGTMQVMRQPERSTGVGSGPALPRGTS